VFRRLITSSAFSDLNVFDSSLTNGLWPRFKSLKLVKLSNVFSSIIAIELSVRMRLSTLSKPWKILLFKRFKAFILPINCLKSFLYYILVQSSNR
jgi:hypothetical protein